MKKKGFTLIELLVVVAIIAILSAIVTANFATAKSKSRDVKRISDMSQIQLALAGYFDRCGRYPTPDSGNTIDNANTLSQSTGCPSGVTFATFIASIPTGPNSGEVYNYATDPGFDDYFLHATLENNNTTANNSLPTVPSWYTPGLNCSQTAKDYCVGPK